MSPCIPATNVFMSQHSRRFRHVPHPITSQQPTSSFSQHPRRYRWPPGWQNPHVPDMKQNSILVSFQVALSRSSKENSLKETHNTRRSLSPRVSPATSCTLFRHTRSKHSYITTQRTPLVSPQQPLNNLKHCEVLGAIFFRKAFLHAPQTQILAS